MQQFFSRVAARMRFKNFAPEMAQAGKPWAEIARKLLVNFPAQMLSDSRAFTGGGNGDLQVTAAHHRTEEKVAVGNVVYAIAKYVALNRASIDGGINFRRVCRCDHEVVTVKVGEFKVTLDPFKPAFGGQFANFHARIGCNDAQSASGLAQAANLIARNIARANQQAATAFELEEDGKKATH
jgi:hypothetical protein